MSPRVATWLAWTVWGLTVPAMALTLFLTALNVPSSSLRNIALICAVILACSTVGALVASGAALIVRFRRSRGDEREQLKWFAYAVGVMVVVFTIWFSFALAGFVSAGALVFTVPLTGVPVATGIAIFKYRLYDIDVIIHRTLVYGLPHTPRWRSCTLGAWRRLRLYFVSSPASSSPNWR